MPVRRLAAWFLIGAVVLTAACGVTYLEAQQLLRSSANSPQEQLAEDAAHALDAGATPASLVGPGSAATGLAGTGTVDVETSLAPFVAIYDAGGAVLATNGELNGSAPVPPPGVLASAASNGRDAVTWQPRPGERIATVVIAWKGGTALAGRSLRVVEQQEDAALTLAAVGWLCGPGRTRGRRRRGGLGARRGPRGSGAEPGVAVGGDVHDGIEGAGDLRAPVGRQRGLHVRRAAPRAAARRRRRSSGTRIGPRTRR